MDILTRVNWVDFLIVIIVLRTVYVSFKSGFTHQLFPLVGSILMVIACLAYYGPFGHYLENGLSVSPPDLAYFLAFVILVVGTGLALKFLRHGFDLIVKIDLGSFIERTGGAICGLLRSLVAANLVLMVLCMAPVPYLQVSVRDRSLAGNYVLAVGPVIYEKAARLIPAIVPEKGTADRKDILEALHADKTVKLNRPGTRTRKAGWEKKVEDL